MFALDGSLFRPMPSAGGRGMTTLKCGKKDILAFPCGAVFCEIGLKSKVRHFHCSSFY